ncbi:DUF4157 domain-containing protein [Streptomyces sp. NPDC056468]|uniref:eCIS core domain-containing protein n=1 Tax=Streptomyces sp. NPDC056468 TaxID=3345830 RepID=UPI00367E3EB7
MNHTSRAYRSAPKNRRTGAAKERQAGDRAATHVHLRRSFGNQYLGALHDCRRQAAPRPACDTPEPLKPDLRSDLEGRFGTDLASIRLHAGPRADADARRLGADAFTTGQDIFFRSGRFAPATREGLRLLAHEVTHTIQQRQRGRARGPAGYGTVSDPADPAELEAHLVADRLVRGVPVPPIGRGGRAGPTAAVLLSPASDTISRHTSWYGDLDERALGRELLNRARAGDLAFVQDTLDALGSTDRDDVAYEFCAAANDPDIVRMTTSAAGRAVIDRLFDELTEGSKDADEQRQADRLMRVKAARIRPEDFLTGVRAAKVFPFRAPGFTVLDDAPISAQRMPGGRIRVHIPNRVLGTAMFRAETRTLPVDTFIGGIELPENEIVGVRLYDLGGVLVYRPALILVELSNETTTTVLTKLAEAVGIGLTLGAGSLVGLGVEATMAARVLLWADRAAFVLGTLTSVIKEHRGEILARFGEPGREFLQYVDYVQSATAIYGFARVALSLGQLVNGLRTAYNNLRTAAGGEGATGGLAGDLTANTEELLRKAEDIQGAKASAAPPTASAPEAPSVPKPIPRGFDPQGRLPRAGTRAVYHQGQAPTCGPVACGMVVDTMGQPHDLAKMVRVAGPDGTPMDVVLQLMRRHRIDADLRTGLTVDDLARATSSRAGGNPTLALIRNTTGARQQEVLHYVVVDGVTTRMGQKVVAVRNPWGTQYFELVDVFAKDFTGQAITVNYSF